MIKGVIKNPYFTRYMMLQQSCSLSHSSH